MWRMTSLRSVLTILSLAGGLGAGFSGLRAASPVLGTEQVRDNPNQQKGTARLSGSVVARDTGKPLRGAQVYVSGTTQTSLTNQALATDDDGRWVARDLPAGSYTVRAQRTGFVARYYGQPRASLPPTTIDLRAGAVVEGIDIRLPRAGVIAGRIFDELGEPVSGVLMLAMIDQYSDGQRRLVDMSNGNTTTNDLGEYRLYGLPPGDYYVRAQSSVALSSPSRRARYLPAYFPGTIVEAEAQRVTLGEGQQVTDLSFGIAPIPVVSVSGLVQDMAGQPVAGGQVFLRQSGRGSSGGGSTQVRADGSFVLPLVASGEYLLHYGRGGGGGGVGPLGVGPLRQGGAATLDLVSTPMPLTIGGQDVSNVSIVLSKGATASGRLVFDGAPPPTITPMAFMVTASSSDPGAGNVRNSRPNGRGDFVLPALTGQQLIRVQAFSGSMPPEVMLKGVRLNGRDITDQGLDFTGRDEVANIEVVMTTRLSAISGTVRDDSGKPVLDYDVVVFSPDTTRWSYRTRYIGRAHADREGRFLIRGLPPADYLVVAVPSLDAGDESDPERLAGLRRYGAPLRLIEGDARTLALRLTQEQ